jgi:dimethyladenosine transferase 1
MSLLPRLPSIRELIKLYGLSAKSQLSQNFILDKNITGTLIDKKLIEIAELDLTCKKKKKDKIVRTAHVSENTPLVIEVGPGPGLLSRSILDAGARKVIAIEKDDRFIPTLHVSMTFNIVFSKSVTYIYHSNYQKLLNVDFK